MNIDHLNYNICHMSEPAAHHHAIQVFARWPAHGRRDRVRASLLASTFLAAFPGSFIPAICGFVQVPMDAHALTRSTVTPAYPVCREAVWIDRLDRDLSGQRVLEAGSGAGRFTEVLVGAGPQVVSFDYSWRSMPITPTTGIASNLFLFHSDIFNIPLIDTSFDKVVSLSHSSDIHPTRDELFRASLGISSCIRPIHDRHLRKKQRRPDPDRSYVAPADHETDRPTHAPQVRRARYARPCSLDRGSTTFSVQTLSMHAWCVWSSSSHAFS